MVLGLTDMNGLISNLFLCVGRGRNLWFRVTPARLKMEYNYNLNTCFTKRTPSKSSWLLLRIPRIIPRKYQDFLGSFRFIC